MPSKENEKLKFNQYQKADKAPFINNADLEYIENIDRLKTILEIHLQRN